MRNHIIVNGWNTLTVPGMVIQQLPAIIRPPMRVQEQTIDGVSGSKFTQLGYDSYEKTVLIGLHSNYDLDRISQHLQAKTGNVVFSNEPDRVYDYTIFKPIDYSRLGRFRQADVTFTVQPFKKTLNLSPITPTPGTTGIVSIPSFGNVTSYPIIELTGQGIITFYDLQSDIELLQINLGSGESVTIDCEAQNAYTGAVLMNRQVVGDYKALGVTPGGDAGYRWVGQIDYLRITNYEWWI